MSKGYLCPNCLRLFDSSRAHPTTRCADGGRSTVKRRPGQQPSTPKRAQIGVNNGASHLTEEAVIWLKTEGRRLRHLKSLVHLGFTPVPANYTYRHLRDMVYSTYGIYVSEQVIRGVVLGNTWRHLEA